MQLMVIAILSTSDFSPRQSLEIMHKWMLYLNLTAKKSPRVAFFSLTVVIIHQKSTRKRKNYKAKEKINETRISCMRQHVLNNMEIHATTFFACSLFDAFCSRPMVSIFRILIYEYDKSQWHSTCHQNWMHFEEWNWNAHKQKIEYLACNCFYCISCTVACGFFARKCVQNVAVLKRHFQYFKYFHSV